MPHEQVRFNLLQRIERNTNDDEQARPAKKLRKLRVYIHLHHERRQHGDNRQEDGTRQGDLRQDVVDVYRE